MANLTQAQREFLDKYIRALCESESGAGEITIIIRNRHVRSLVPSQVCHFPKPEDEPEEKPHPQSGGWLEKER